MRTKINVLQHELHLRIHCSPNYMLLAKGKMSRNRTHRASYIIFLSSKFRKRMQFVSNALWFFFSLPDSLLHSSFARVKFDVFVRASYSIQTKVKFGMRRQNAANTTYHASTVAIEASEIRAYLCLVVGFVSM